MGEWMHVCVGVGVGVGVGEDEGKGGWCVYLRGGDGINAGKCLGDGQAAAHRQHLSIATTATSTNNEER